MSRSLDDLLTTYQLLHPELGDKAFDQYAIACRLFSRWLGRAATVDDLTSTLVGGFMGALRRSGKHKPRTINNKRSVLRTLSRFAFDQGMIPEIIETGRLKEEEKIPNAFSMAEMAAILGAAREAPPLPTHVCSYHKNLWYPEHWEILLRLIWETGHRLAALLDCPRSAVNSDGVLLMPASLTKSKREQRHKLSRKLMTLIDEQPTHRGLLLPWPLCRKAIWEKLDRHILKPAGIPCDRFHKFHCLRRTSGSHLLRAVNDIRAVSRHLGHNDVKVTERYIDPAIAYDEQSACDVLPLLE